MNTKPTCKVNWTCYKCKHAHRWAWYQDEIEAGPIILTCEECWARNPCRIDENGNVTPDVEPATKTTTDTTTVHRIQAKAVIAGILYQSCNLKFSACQEQAAIIMSAVQQLGWKPSGDIS